MKGYRVWVMSLLEYDEYGNATVISSFSKPAKDSPIKSAKKKKATRVKSRVESGEEDLWTN